jgi:hypothetical protein
MKFLKEMKAYIPYAQIEKMLIKEGVYHPKRAGDLGQYSVLL